MSNVVQSSSGIGCVSLLGILFIGLKLTHYIDWSWWWVLSPFIFQTVAIFVLLGIVLLIAILKDW